MFRRNSGANSSFRIADLPRDDSQRTKTPMTPDTLKG